MCLAISATTAPHRETSTTEHHQRTPRRARSRLFHHRQIVIERVCNAREANKKKNYRLFSVDFSLSKNEWKHETRFFSCYKCTRRSVSLSCASALVLDLLNEWVLTNASFVSCPCVCMLRILEFKSIAINGNKLKIGRWNLTSRFCRERSVWKWNVLF